MPSFTFGGLLMPLAFRWPAIRSCLSTFLISRNEKLSRPREMSLSVQPTSFSAPTLLPPLLGGSIWYTLGFR
eukprot:scaffold1061_cov65-Cyclotella_meneghiniana.AAC.4